MGSSREQKNCLFFALAVALIHPALPPPPNLHQLLHVKGETIPVYGTSKGAGLFFENLCVLHLFSGHNHVVQNALYSATLRVGGGWSSARKRETKKKEKRKEKSFCSPCTRSESVKNYVYWTSVMS